MGGFDVLVYCLLVGMVFGVLKIRVMEIINELENEKRNVYVGVVGYVSFLGNFDMVFVIWMMVVKDEKVYV